MGVSIATATAAPASSSARDHAAAARHPRATAAASIDRPMMFRMSTLSSVCDGAPPLISHDCSRNRNARPKICQPRRRASAAASASVRPLPHARAARQRQRNARQEQEDRAPPMPPTNRSSRTPSRARSVEARPRIEAWPSTMTSTATPRSQSR